MAVLTIYDIVKMPLKTKNIPFVDLATGSSLIDQVCRDFFLDEKFAKKILTRIV